MSRVSQKNFNRLAGEAISVLKDHYPIALSTRQVAAEMVRDKEFCAKLLLFLKDKGYVVTTQRNNGGEYCRWQKWRLSDTARERFVG